MIEIPEISQIAVSSLKAQDKRQLLDNFFTDERVQILVS